jgi:hypothetical protein
MKFSKVKILAHCVSSPVDADSGTVFYDANQSYCLAILVMQPLSAHKIQQ